MTTIDLSLPDADARRTVTAELGANLFVEAGAGSGKTSSLVTRIVNMVASGVPIGRIAAITFTEAAARELRTRVRDELERRATDRQDRLLAVAAAQVESAAITTLHGFALRILADHPVESGLPPGFGVADEIASMLDFDESWRLFTGKVGDDLDLLELQERAAVLGVELRRFADIARRFDDNWDLLAGIERNPPALSSIDVDEMLDELVHLTGLVEHCIDERDGLAAGLLALRASVEDCRRFDPLTKLEWLDTQLPWPGRRSGRKGSWVRMDVDEVRKHVEAARASVDQTIARYRIEVIAHFVAKVAHFVEQRVAERQASGRLAFHDLLVLARRLLRSNELVREELHQRYAYLLLDEFQDTDPIQIELAVLIAAEGAVGDRAWQELAAELSPGRLVVVGDPKQSIYRFRRADIAVYSDAEQALVANTERLTANFRSVPGVVSWVNDFFGREIGDGDLGAQPAYVSLDAIRKADPEAATPVITIGGPHPKAVSVGEIREEEAADVAAVICRALEEEWRTERDGQWRPVRLQDIAVLIPSRLSLPALEAAFGAANIPFRPETSSLVYATQEVRDVLAGVRAVVDPSSSVDVVAALRSSLFAIGDDDLLAWHLAGRGWNYVEDAGIDLVGPEEGSPEAPASIEAAFAELRRWYQDRWWMAPSALIERIVRERRLREAALAEPRPRDRWRRHRFLAEQAREFAETQGGDLNDFLAWVEIQSSDLARVTEPIPAEPDDDAVRVLTVHGSKGLEFGVVVLAGAPTREVNRMAGAQVLFPRGATPEVKLAKGKSSQFFDIHASVEEVLDRHERVRLHYVAATRARDILVVSAHHKEGMQSIGLRTWNGLQEAPHLWRGFERCGDERYLVEPPTQLRLTDGDHETSARAWHDEQERLQAGTVAGRTFSPSGLVDEIAGPIGDRDHPGGGRGPAFGSAVHDVLQTIDLHDPAGIDEVARLSAERHGVGSQAVDVAAFASTVLTAPSVALARNHRFHRELYVATTVGDALIEGYVDLCIEGDDGLIVVDYKTDLVASDDDITAKLDRYRLQAAAYAIGLEAVTGQPVVDCRFVFISRESASADAPPSGVEERSVTDLDEAKALVLAHVGP